MTSRDEGTRREQAAIRRCQQGEIDGLGVLFELHHVAVFRTAYGIVRRRDVADDVTQQVSVTHHGPVISGSPEAGSGLAFKYTATQGPSTWPDTLWQMLLAKGSDELIESLREWVDLGIQFCRTLPAKKPKIKSV